MNNVFIHSRYDILSFASAQGYEVVFGDDPTVSPVSVIGWAIVVTGSSHDEVDPSYPYENTGMSPVVIMDGRPITMMDAEDEFNVDGWKVRKSHA
jgi:hypothetical protein